MSLTSGSHLRTQLGASSGELNMVGDASRVIELDGAVATRSKWLAYQLPAAKGWARAAGHARQSAGG
jgi:hypothetical protein